jgi:hypothetical protein
MLVTRRRGLGEGLVYQVVSNHLVRLVAECF